MKVLIYGAGYGGERLYEEIKKDNDICEIKAFIDQNKSGKKKELPIIRPEEIFKYEYDLIYIATIDTTVKEMLIKEYNVQESKINEKRFIRNNGEDARVRTLEHVSELSGIFSLKGSVAELGVFQGDFAKEINRCFPESTIYLYDTFEGFDDKDIDKEKNREEVESFQHLKNTSVDLVLSKLPHPEKAIIRKGYFPDTATGENDKYIFVNLDADLYGPTLAGLQFFWEKMVPGGVILVHDYFNPVFPGVQKAVVEFMLDNEISITPIGDSVTIALAKPYK